MAVSLRRLAFMFISSSYDYKGYVPFARTQLTSNEALKFKVPGSAGLTKAL